MHVLPPTQTHCNASDLKVLLFQFPEKSNCSGYTLKLIRFFDFSVCTEWNYYFKIFDQTYTWTVNLFVRHLSRIMELKLIILNIGAVFVEIIHLSIHINKVAFIEFRSTT